MLHRRVLWIATFIIAAVFSCLAQTKSNQSIAVVFKDGHQKNFPLSTVSGISFKKDAMVIAHDGRQESIPVNDIVRMDFHAGSSKSLPMGRNHFLGKWEFGTGQGSDTFTVTLDADGQAHKSIGAPHGTWVLVDNEARISWDDGWHDVIRKVGGKHQKFAFEPGKSFTDQPSNVSTAESLNGETM